MKKRRESYERMWAIEKCYENLNEKYAHIFIQIYTVEMLSSKREEKYIGESAAQNTHRIVKEKGKVAKKLTNDRR